MIRALLIALLDAPASKLAETHGDSPAAWLCRKKRKRSFGVVWITTASKKGVPPGAAWLSEMKQYEKAVLSKRS